MILAKKFIPYVVLIGGMALGQYGFYELGKQKGIEEAPEKITPVYSRIIKNTITVDENGFELPMIPSEYVDMLIEANGKKFYIRGRLNKDKLCEELYMINNNHDFR